MSKYVQFYTKSPNVNSLIKFSTSIRNNVCDKSDASLYLKKKEVCY